jgi:putative alpha-1,2-mannosidase
MMGIYPISPGDPIYTITTPMFDKITIQLDPKYYKKKSIVIEREKNNDGKINKIELNGKTHNSFFISHEDFVNGTTLKVIQN